MPKTHVWSRSNVLRLRLLLSLFVTAATLSIHMTAQTSAGLPDSPGHTGATLTGMVTDAQGGIIPGAQLTLKLPDALPDTPTRTLTLDATGTFRFADLPAGAARLTVTAPGFTTVTLSDIALQPHEMHELPPIVLSPAVSTTVNVVYTRQQMAEEEMKLEEKQRVIGIIPNFYVTYNWNAPPLTAGQKFRLALRSSIDPVDFLGAGFIAGVEQSQNDYSGYGQGAQGYGKRFGAAFADDTISMFVGSAVLPSILHQDPRYFYKGTGTIRARTLYAISTIVITRGDNGRWQPNYSNVLGNFAAAGISNLYYPATDRGARLTIDNALIGTASGAIGALFQEFLIKKLSTGIHTKP